MALVSYVTKDDAAERLRPILEGIEKKLGAVPNVLLAMAQSPDLFEGFLALNGALSKTKLNPKLRELAYMKVSELNGCAYCMHHHREYGKKAGLTEAQISDLERYDSSDAYDDLQRDVLHFATEVTRHVTVSDPLMDRLKQALSDREIVELAMTVGIANFTNRVTETLRMDLP